MLKQLANERLCRLVVPLPEMLVDDLAAPIEKVLRGPVPVVVRVPGGMVVVHRHGIGDTQLLDRVLDVRGVLLERKLRRVHAHDLEAHRMVALIPSLEMGQRPKTVDARVGPEIDEHDLAA